jgi:hypothetical protein
MVAGVVLGCRTRPDRSLKEVVMGSKDITPRLSESPRQVQSPRSIFWQPIVGFLTVVLIHIQIRGSIPRKVSIQLMTDKSFTNMHIHYIYIYFFYLYEYIAFLQSTQDT